MTRANIISTANLRILFTDSFAFDLLAFGNMVITAFPEIKASPVNR